MVLQCKMCGEMIGVHYPYNIWTVDRDAVCVGCAERERLMMRPETVNHSTPDVTTAYYQCLEVDASVR